MKDLPGFNYDARRKVLVLDGYVRGNRKMRRQRTFRNVTRDQALKLWKKFRADLDSGRAIEGPLTLRKFIERFYDRIAASHRDSTRKTQQVIIQNHLLRYFGDASLDEITSIRIIDFMADMRQRRLSGTYINNAVRVLKMLLRQAVERDVLADYPIKKKIPKEKEKPLRQELTSEERARFFAVFDDEVGFRRFLDNKRQLGPMRESESFPAPRRFGGGMRGDSKAAGAAFERFRELRDLFVISVETGLRKSDLRNLRWDQIDLVGGFIRVLMQKTALEAEIPISGMCRDVLHAAKTRCGRGEYVFIDLRGNRYSFTRIRRVFVMAKALAGISRPFRPHDLRHTFGCRLASKSVGLQIIAKALGHTTTRMAERYARPSADAMRSVVAALDADPLPFSTIRP